MRVLFLTCQPPHHMAPPVLGDEQVNCGPCFPDEHIGGRWISRSTPYGEFDVRALAAEFVGAQKPDVVVCHVDCGFGIKPRHVDAFGCPVVMIAADSHWGEHAVSSMVAYAGSEPFDRLVVVYDRHHVEFYRAAGLRNVHWFPGLTFTHSDARIAAAGSPCRAHHLALIGKTGYHARRQRAFAALINARLPLAWREMKQSDVVAFYASSLIGLNAAMNGDLNLRVFETLAGGAMLLTDALAPASGLDDLLAEGRHKVSYHSVDDLVEKARFYLARPQEAAAIGQAGKQWFNEHFSESRRRLGFAQLVADGTEFPEFALPASRPRFDFGRMSVGNAVAGYDVVNELHRHQESVTVRIDDTVPPVVEKMLRTLPRVRLLRSRDQPGALADVAVLGYQQHLSPATLRCRHAWPWDMDVAGQGERWREQFRAARWTTSGSGYVFAGPAPRANEAAGKVTQARRQIEAGDLAGALKAAQLALAVNPRSADALLLMAEIAAAAGKGDLARATIANARRVEPQNPRISLLEWTIDHAMLPTSAGRNLATAWKAVESLDFAAAAHFAGEAYQAEPSGDALYAFALAMGRLTSGLRLSRGRLQRLIALVQAATRAPERYEVLLSTATALHGLGAYACAEQYFARTVALEPRCTWAWHGRIDAVARVAGIAAAEQIRQEAGRVGVVTNIDTATVARAHASEIPSSAQARIGAAVAALADGPDGIRRFVLELLRTPPVALEREADASLPAGPLISDQPAYLKLMYQGAFAIAFDDAAHGIGLLRQATRQNPEAAEAWHVMGVGLMRCDRAAEAVDMLLHAAYLRQGDTEIMHDLALAAEQLGNHAIAAECQPDAGGKSASGERSGQAPECDLLVCHAEINHRQGTGVLLKRYFPDQANFVTLRSRTLYGGAVEFGGTHLALDVPGLSLDERRRRIRLLLSPYRVRRILCVPFFREDVLHALFAAEATGAPLAVHVMDDQALYGSEVRRSEAEQLMRAARLRLTISPEMCAAYQTAFGLDFGILPPLVRTSQGRVTNRWSPSSGKAAVLVGNIWTETQFERLRRLVIGTGLKLDWFGNHELSWLEGRKPDLERDGISCRGFLPETELAEKVAQYACVLVPSGLLDGTEADEWLTRLSLPSRMVFILCQTHTPMLVMGHPDTCAARFVARFGVGASCDYDPAEAMRTIAGLMEPTRHARLVQRARMLADAFVCADVGDWLWRSLAEGRPLPAPFAEVFARSNDASAADEGSLMRAPTIIGT